MIVENFDYNVVFSVYTYRAYAQLDDILKLVAHLNGHELSPENLDDAWDKAARALANQFPALGEIDLTFCNEYAGPEPLMDKAFSVLGGGVDIEGHGFPTQSQAPFTPAVRHG